MKLLDSFLKISLHSSKQEPSVITLQNMVERIEDMKEELQKKESDFELIDCFPIVGWGLNIDKKKVNNKRKFKVTKISSVEKIVDESVLCNTNKKILKDQPNCILPLFYEEENNRELLKCELFRRKMSYMLLGNVDKYQDDSHLIIMQSTLKFLLDGQLNYSWQNDLIRQIYETCKLIFVGEPNYSDKITSEQFKQSEFKLLNIFCLSLSKEVTPQTIFEDYIMPKIQRYPCLNAEINENFKNFFDKLEFANPETIYQNLEVYIQNYLISKHYFYFELVQKRRIFNLIQILIPQQNIDKIYEQIPFLKYEEIDEQNGLTEEEYELKQKIIGYTMASVHQYLLKSLITSNQILDQNNIQIFSDIVDYNDTYKTFLQNHSQFDFLLQFAQLLSEKDEKLFIKLVISQVQINKVFNFKENKFKCSNDILVKLQNNCQEFNQGYQIINNMIQILNYTENQNNLKNIIYIIISEIIWLNNWVKECNFNKKEDIVKILKIFQEYTQDENRERYQQVYLYNLNDVSKYCYRLKMKTCNFQKFMLENLDDDEIELPKKDVMSRICQHILRVSKEHFKGEEGK